jgi:hypothetical protein
VGPNQTAKLGPDQGSEINLLYAYQDLDSKLTKFEDSVEQLAIVIDRAIQREIDIRRGK